MLLWLALLGVLVAIAAAEEGEEIDLDDLDDSDMAEDEQGGTPPGPVEDFDKDMPQEVRMRRMQVCLHFTVARFGVYKEQVAQAVRDIVANQETSEEQAVNSLLVSWMMMCYINLDDGVVKEAERAGALTTEQDLALFTPAKEGQTPATASQRQWELLEEAVMIEKKRKEMEPRSRGDPDGGPAETLAVGGTNSLVYVILVFSVIFGLGTLALLWLMRSEETAKTKKAAEKKKKRS